MLHLGVVGGTEASVETCEEIVTKDKKFKRKVRERMAKTGESYTTARSFFTGEARGQGQDLNKECRCGRTRGAHGAIPPHTIGDVCPGFDEKTQ